MTHGLRWLGFGSGLIMGTIGMTSTAWAEQPLFVAYPPDGHETTSAQIFLIGTAPASGQVTVNGRAIDRSPAGHFAPSFPLQVGENLFTLNYQNQVVTLHVKRLADAAAAPVGGFGAGSLMPAVDIARLPSEPICFGAIAPPNATVSVTLSHQTIALLPQPSTSELPPNSAVLTLQNQPVPAAQSYQGCITGETWYSSPVLTYGSGSGTVLPSHSTRLNLGYPQFQLTLAGKTVTEQGKGKVEILSPAAPLVVEVTAESGTARTGASTDYSRLTPLPKGTRSAVTAQEGEWLRLDYGGWIKAAETQAVPNAVLPQTLIRSVRASQVGDWTEVSFPLQVPVPLSVQQSDRTFTLTLYNTTAQTDIIALDTDPAIARLDWQQIAPGQVQYTFQLKTQPWGYKLRYEGTTLILSLKHPPRLTHQKPLSGISVLLDPGHGGPEDFGSRGPTGYPEKEITLIMANLVRARLIAQGATVYMTREGDIDLYPNDRANLINQMEPTIAISLHYNALPDSGDARNTRGVGAFWYNTQAHSLADSLHNTLVKSLNRPSYGIFWDNLALTRPTVAPAVLLELGFMTNPEEFEWITNPQEQKKLADAIAEEITRWLEQNTRN